MYELFRTEEFKRDYQSLTQNEKQAIRRALERLKDDLRYPSLRVKKMQGRDDVWEARASEDLRILFVIDKPETLILRTCGHHDSTLRK